MEQNRFVRTQTGEPHSRRRLELLARYPEIKKLFGYDRRTAWVTPAVVAAQLALAWLVSDQPWWVVLLASWCAGAVLSHWLAMAIHESSHRLAARTRSGNIALALFANVPLVLPLALSFHRYHLAHHKALNVLGEDRDLPLELELPLIGDSTVRKLIYVLLHPFVALLRGVTYAQRPNRGELLNAALIIAVDVLIWRCLGPSALVYLALSFVFALGLHPLAAHFLHEHYAFAGHQETFSYYGPLNRLAINVGHHNEHHDFMAVSGWRLPELTRLVPEYRSLVSHASWTGVLWRFITDRRLPYGRRIVRTPEDFQRGRPIVTRQRSWGANG